MSYKILVLLSVACLIASGCSRETESKVELSKTEESSASEKELDQASDEMLSSFSVSGFAKGGKKQWDLEGKSADIMAEEIKLLDVLGKVYGKDTNMTIVADEGSLNRIDNNVHLEKNVVVTTDDGATLTTDFLDWDAQNQVLSSDAPVWLKREMMEADGIGIKGFPGLSQVQLKKDVTVKLFMEETKDDLVQTEKEDNLQSKATVFPTVITCDGPLKVDYQNNLAVFQDNVRVKDQRGDIIANRMDVYFNTQTEEGKQIQGMEGMGIDKLIAIGDVEIHHGGNISYSEKAVYDTNAGNLTLTGQPKLVIYSSENLSQLMGTKKESEVAENKEK